MSRSNRWTKALSTMTLVAFAGAAAPVALAQPSGGRGGGVAEAAAAGKAELLPLTHITLYRSGVGAFLRQGPVAGNASIQLRFDVSQINDVLKTLQVLDKGGRVDSVSYPSKDPLSRRLASFSLQIGDNPSLPSLLERLRGTNVTLTVTEGTVSGSVLSVETRKMPTGAGDKVVVVDTPVVNLVTGTGIRSVAVPTISSFQISDKQLAEELTRALAALAESRAERSKTVDVSLSGDGTRTAAIAYVHETPVWKTSYRLMLADPAAKGEGKPADPAKAKGGGMLQGWALVENTTDQDWTNVKLSLVSGRPVSFRMDLFEPLYAFRPEVAVPMIAGVNPRMFDGGMDGKPASAARGADPMSGKADMAGRARSGRGTEGGPGGVGGGGFAAPAMPVAAGMPAESSGRFVAADGAPPGSSDWADYGARSRATGGDVGETFQFSVDTPLTIERQRSAMIPFISANIDAARVSIFNVADRADHPMRGVWITNSSDLQLLPGPLAVYDGAAYAGDAQIGQVSPGDRRLIAFAVDLDVAAQTSADGGGSITKLRIVGGSFEVTSSETQAMTYTFDSKDQKRDRTIVLEHPKFDGWELKSDLKPVESTQNTYRFALELPAGKKVETKVSQSRVVRQAVGIFDYDLEAVARFQAEGKLSPAVLAAMRELFAKRGAVMEQERLIGLMDQQLSTLKTDQSRISKMLADLDKQTDTYKNLLSKLNRQEGEIDGLTTRRAEAAKALEGLRSALTEAVRNLNVD